MNPINFHLKNSNIEFLKIFAIIFMFIDHYATIVEWIPALKYAGRIVFPLFSIVLVYNYIYNTRSKKRYIWRLFAFGLIVQPVFHFAFFEFNKGLVMNIFLTLSLGLAIIYGYEKISLKNPIKRFFYFVTTFGILIPFENNIEYGLLGVMMIVSLYFLVKYKEIEYLIIAAILTFLINYTIGYMALIGTSAILFAYLVQYANFGDLRLNKWFFYLFYPVHLALLYFWARGDLSLLSSFF